MALCHSSILSFLVVSFMQALMWIHSARKIWVISLDVEKALDYVEWPHMATVLQLCNCGDHFCSAFHYNSPKWRVPLAKMLQPFSPLARVCRQVYFF